jgi:hypothetical protein
MVGAGVGARRLPSQPSAMPSNTTAATIPIALKIFTNLLRSYSLNFQQHSLRFAAKIKPIQVSPLNSEKRAKLLKKWDGHTRGSLSGTPQPEGNRLRSERRIYAAELWEND